MISIFLRHNGECPCTAGNVYAPALRIIEQIIGIPHTLHTGNLFAGLGIENHEYGWFAKADKQPMMGFVQRQRKIRLSALEWPGRHDGAFISIHYRDVMG